MPQQPPVMTKGQIRMMIFAIFALIIIVIIAMSITTIDAGHVGVKKVFGKVSENVLDEGLHFVAPWVEVAQVDTRIQNVTISALANDVKAAISKDTQTVGFTIDLAYNVDFSRAWMIVKFVGESTKELGVKILEPAAWQGTKEVISQYSIEEIPNQREAIRKEIGERVRVIVEERMKKRFESASSSVQINQVTLANIDYSDDYERTIEEKMVAAQNVLKAENELSKFKVEQKQAVAKAEQQARADVIKANGEAIAYLTKLGAEITAYAKLRTVGFSPATYNFLATWDGKLPNVLAGNEMLQGLIVPADKLEKMDAKDIQLLLGDIQTQKANLAKEMERLSKEALKDNYKPNHNVDETPNATESATESSE